MRTIAVLGSTGSVGTQTLSVLARNPGRYDVQLLAGNSNWRLMEEQVRQFSPRWVSLADPVAARELAQRLGDLPVQVLSGEKELLALVTARKFSLLVAAMVGSAGLQPVIAAIKAGSDIALANKEVLVLAGQLVTRLCREKGVNLLPLDSEHSAIFQCLKGQCCKPSKLLLTASGGPFLGKTWHDLKDVTPAMAVKHPNWQMGAKISVDSASLMNKGLEIIEAHWLFDVAPSDISVLIHPQSIIHSMVEFIDGAVLAQLGVPSMEVPIQYALSWPQRWPGTAQQFVDWLSLPPLTFQQPDMATFPCLELARAALIKGGNSPAVLSSANDLCVEAFLRGKLTFTGIPEVLRAVSTTVPWQEQLRLEDILEAMEQAQSITCEILKSME